MEGSRDDRTDDEEGATGPGTGGIPDGRNHAEPVFRGRRGGCRRATPADSAAATDGSDSGEPSQGAQSSVGTPEPEGLFAPGDDADADASAGASGGTTTGDGAAADDDWLRLFTDGTSPLAQTLRGPLGELRPDSRLAETMRGPMYELSDRNSNVARTLSRPDSGDVVGGEVGDVTADLDYAEGTAGDAVEDTTGAVEDTTNTVDDTTNTVDDTTGTVEDTVDDTTDTVEDTTDTVDDTTDTVDDTTGGTTNDTTDTVDETVDDTTDTVDDTTDMVTGNETSDDDLL
ncbi:hypothetical protein BRC89_12000 [Halobacteriales archaeon QS_4_70_19]|nr:MAG: hypothetical protein BRC89_12000 [Halobacteriales archaeon QS_4_70_19]